MYLSPRVKPDVLDKEVHSSYKISNLPASGYPAYFPAEDFASWRRGGGTRAGLQRGLPNFSLRRNKSTFCPSPGGALARGLICEGGLRRYEGTNIQGIKQSREKRVLDLKGGSPGGPRTRGTPPSIWLPLPPALPLMAHLCPRDSPQVTPRWASCGASCGRASARRAAAASAGWT